MGLEGFWVIAGVLLAAMPTATNAFMLAQRHDAGADEVSTGVLLSTLLAALAFGHGDVGHRPGPVATCR